MVSAALDIARVSVTFDGVRAVDDVSLALPDGQVLAVVGPSGCGKSTLLRAVAGLDPLTSGSIAWEGEDLAGVPTHRRGFALMFQDGQLFDHLTVARNVGYALRLQGTTRRAASTRVDELLELVGLGGYGDRLPRTLSGGERQRVALARSLGAEPRLLLLDEPLSALDAGLRTRLAADLRRILHEAGTTALLVTHDQEEAFTVADRLAVMRDGRVVQEGTTAEVWAAPADPEAALFLGYAAVLEGPPAAVLLGGAYDAGTAVAVRRSAVTARPEGDTIGQPSGRVVSVHVTPDELRLVIDVDGVGEIPAVGAAGWLPEAGEAVSVRIDRSRLAVLPASPDLRRR